MIKKLIFFKSEGYNPYVNQSVEVELSKYASKDTLVVYLWSNDKTVFIGKNQNAFSECNYEALKKDDGFLARRFTGGGAVYHDKGNLNFTFISAPHNYDKNLNFSIMQSAMKRLGFDATLSGRNDILIDGRKFSGNAFYEGKEFCLHHGTVLICIDSNKLSKYLNVSTQKLNAKGVKSVVSRVVNLASLKPDLNVDMVADAIFWASKNAFPNATVEVIEPSNLDQVALKERIESFSQIDYILGDDVQYDFAVVERFEWGTADIRVKVRNGVIEKIKIYSDSLDTTLSKRQEEGLTGVNIDNYDGIYSDIVLSIKEKLCTI